MNGAGVALVKGVPVVGRKRRIPGTSKEPAEVKERPVSPEEGERRKARCPANGGEASVKIPSILKRDSPKVTTLNINGDDGAEGESCYRE